MDVKPLNQYMNSLFGELLHSFDPDYGASQPGSDDEPVSCAVMTGWANPTIFAKSPF